MPRVPPFDRPATYDDLLKLPGQVVAEIVGGELHATPRPALHHAHTGSRLARVLTPRFDRPDPGGWRLLYEPELHLADDVLVPDWAGWRRQRLPVLPDAAFLTVAPDWVAEILSPSTAPLDRAKKLAIYAREGVAHAWLIDPILRTFEVLQLDAGRWFIVATHAGDEVVRAVPFVEIELRLADFWSDD